MENNATNKSVLACMKSSKVDDPHQRLNDQLVQLDTVFDTLRELCMDITFSQFGIQRQGLDPDDVTNELLAELDIDPAAVEYLAKYFPENKKLMDDYMKDNILVTSNDDLDVKNQDNKGNKQKEKEEESGDNNVGENNEENVSVKKGDVNWKNNDDNWGKITEGEDSGGWNKYYRNKKSTHWYETNAQNEE